MAVTMKKIFALLFIIVSTQLLSRPDLNWSSPPTTISSLGVNASDPSIVVDSNGNSTAIWVENNLIKSSVLPYNGSWSTAVTLSNINSTASSPKMGIDASGTVVAAWIEEGIVKIATLPLNGSWSAATSISNAGASFPSLAVDATGNIVLAWVRNGFVETSTQLLGQSPSLVRMLSSNGNESDPHVSIGANGQVVAVWHSLTGSGNDAIYFAKSIITGSWGSSATVLPATSSMHHHYPHVVVDPFGNATMCWFRYQQNGSTYSNVNVLAATLPSGSNTWSTFTNLTGNGAGMYNPGLLKNNIKIDGSGNVIALWTNSYDGTTFSVEAAELTFGGSWNQRGGLSIFNLYGFGADVAVAPSGDAVAAYMYFDGTKVNIQTAESNINGNTLNFWSAQSDISTDVGNAYPKIAANISSGSIYAASVWISNDGSNDVIKAVTGVGVAVEPPANLSVNQNSQSYGVFTDYYNTLSWSPSNSPNIVQYLLYRNGVLFNTVNSSITQFVDHNAVANGPITYGVAAVDDQFSVSAMATITLF